MTPNPGNRSTESRIASINGTVRSWVFIVLGLGGVVTTFADPAHAPRPQWGIPAAILYLLVVALAVAALIYSRGRAKRPQP